MCYLLATFSALSLYSPPSLPSSLLSPMPSIPPTSPQCNQAAGRYVEHLSHIMGSLEQCRTPAAASSALSAASAPAAPSLPSEGPVTFQRQTYHHLSPELAAYVASMSSVSTALQWHRHSLAAPLLAPAPVSVSLSKKNIKYITYNLQIILPSASASASTSTMAPPQHYRCCLATSLLAPAPVSLNSL